MQLTIFKRRYKTFASVIGTISILLAVILGIIELYKIIFTKEYDLDVVGTFKFYEVPDSLYSDFDSVNIKLENAMQSQDSLARNMKIRNITSAFISRLLNKMNNSDYNIPENVGNSIASISSELYPTGDSINDDKFNYLLDGNKINGLIAKLRNDLHYQIFILKLQVINNGNKKVDDVCLKLNSSRGYYRIKEEELKQGEIGYTDQISDFLENIEIGTIEAKESKNIIIWVGKPLKKEQIRLTCVGNLIEIDYDEFEL